jgi:phosphomannomutase/phosphomannomutase/phosphoglucomutase
MIPWLLVLEILCKSGKPLSELVNERIRLFPASGEINRRLRDPSSAIRKVEETFKPDALVIDATDGLSMEFADWRFNLRCSNTEPVLRLNVEARGSVALMEEKTKEILQMIDLFS